jgi:hypothetical protein
MRAEMHSRVATALALLSDRRLHELVDSARYVGSGIGGTSWQVHVEGVPVFVKRLTLTDLERRPEYVHSTANLFDMPTFCHYGVGAPSMNTWRELAAHVMTTNWVLSGECPSFPLMYHWRALTGPMPSAPRAPELTEIDRTVEFWHGSQAMRHRLEALDAASASILLFLEYVPHNLYQWLKTQLDTLDSACAMVEQSLLRDVRFMNANGLLHFDAHFANILTDGRRLYLADFGLATSPRFELSAAERDFVARNDTHDTCHTITELVNWVVSARTGIRKPKERNDFIRRCAEGREPDAPAIVHRYAAVAVLVNDFYRTLHGERRTVPYPAEEIRRAAEGIQALT